MWTKLIAIILGMSAVASLLAWVWMWDWRFFFTAIILGLVAGGFEARADKDKTDG